MAIDACSKNSTPNTSPRISFSLDIHNTNPGFENKTISSTSSPLDSFSDFDFFFENRIQTEPSSADELFSHGLIRPKLIEPEFITLSRQSSLPSQKSTVRVQKFAPSEMTKLEESTKETSIESQPKSESKSFWRIKRSSSLHGENSYKKSSFWSLPLLLRSYSTGSVPYTKIKSVKENNKQLNSRFSTSTTSSSCSSRRPPLKKKNGVKYNGNGVRVGPILIAPSPVISPNLFGLGSLFSNGKDRKGKK